MTYTTDYYLLYRCHALPLEEAYYLATYNYFITDDPEVKIMINSLCEEICSMFDSFNISSLGEQECCRRYMDEKGYSSYPCSSIFYPISDAYENRSRPQEKQIKNTIDYLGLYYDGLVSLAQAYVLAKNKKLLLDDYSLNRIILELEELIIDEAMNNDSNNKNIDNSIIVKQYILANGFRLDDLVFFL